MMDLSIKIILARHAETQGNKDGILLGHNDSPLTVLGKKQALEIAKQLEKEKIDLLYSSPLGRALQTAKIIANYLDNLKINMEPLLTERDFGILTGKHRNEIHLHAKQLFKTSNFVYFLDAKDAEDFPSLFKRAQDLLIKLNQQHSGKTILLVAHA